MTIRTTVRNVPSGTTKILPNELVMINGNLHVGVSQLFPHIDVRKHGAVGDGITNDTVALQAALDAVPTSGGLVIFPKGTFIINRPLIVKSNTTIRGDGSGTLIRNDSTGGSGALGGMVFMFGHYHPNALPLWTVDTLTLPTAGVKTVTRSSSTLSIAVGDLVFIAVTMNTGAIGQYLRRVEAVSGNDVTLHIPINDFPLGTVTSATISKGQGWNTSIDGVVVPSYLSERITVENLAVHSTHFYWTGRTATLDSTFRNIDVRQSGALIYGNAYQSCVFDTIRGYYSTRCVELTDGAGGNNIRNLIGVWRNGPGYSATDTVIQIGTGGTINGFDITDTPSRLGGTIVKFLHPKATVRNGILRLATVDCNVLQFGGNDRGSIVDNLEITATGQIQADVIRLLDATNCTVRNVRINSLGGYAASVYTIRQRTGCVNVVVDGVIDANGSTIYQSVAEFLPSSHKYSNLSWTDTGTKVKTAQITGELDHDGTTVGFYSTTPITKPTSVTARAALEALGLGASLVSEGGGETGTANVIGEYPPISRSTGMTWLIPSLGHSAIWSGSEWIAQMPQNPNVNLCCILSSFTQLYDSQQYVSGDLQNLGTGSASNHVLTDVTIGTDGSGRQYLNFNGTSSMSTLADSPLWTLTTTEEMTLIAICQPTPAQTSVALYGNRGSLTSLSSIGMNLYIDSGGAYSTRFGDGTTAPSPNTSSLGVTPGVNIDFIIGARNVVNDTIVIGANGNYATAADTTLAIDSTFANRIGRLGGSGTAYSAMHGYVFGMVRRALNTSELVVLTDWWKERFT